MGCVCVYGVWGVCVCVVVLNNVRCDGRAVAHTAVDSGSVCGRRFIAGALTVHTPSIQTHSHTPTHPLFTHADHFQRFEAESACALDVLCAHIRFEFATQRPP